MSTKQGRNEPAHEPLLKREAGARLDVVDKARPCFLFFCCYQHRCTSTLLISFTAFQLPTGKRLSVVAIAVASG